MIYFHLSLVFASSLLYQNASAWSWGHRQHVVDLGYAKHKPTYVNVTSAGAELLNYNNIRFAQPPVGPLRFRKPVTPPTKQRGIQDGNLSYWETDCLSSAPGGVPFPLINGTTWGSEDCLFLNVVVPKGVKEGDNVPVLHWVVGSAYAFGGKEWTGMGLSTHGLFNRPLNLTDKFIIVTHNYRLGVPGWLPKLGDDMNGNMGVWDTLAAIEWTKKHICKFGGDPDNLTVIGQSAGAGIITWMLLGEEGNLKLPFDKAWIASPSIAPRHDLERSRPIFNDIMDFTNCLDVQCLRNLSESDMVEVNQHIFVDQNPGAGGGSLGPGVGLTPTVDGELVTDLPATAFAAGKFNKQVKKVVVGHTAYEGLGLSSDRDMPARFPEIVWANIPNATNETVAAIQSLYPFPPELPETLAWDYTTDVVWSCTVDNIAEAYADRARRFVFSVPPATHGLDLAYFFYADNTTTPIPSVEVALASEHLLLQFMFGKDIPIDPSPPLAKLLSEWKYFSEDTTTANITTGGFEFGSLAERYEKRCALINSVLQDPDNGV